MNTYKLSQSTIEKLEHYVYLLIDPRTQQVFYVGKGHGNRINQHLIGALKKGTPQTPKVKRIREIEKAGGKVGLTILRHGLTKEMAFELESAMIDSIGKNKLTNKIQGHDSTDRGMMTLEDIKIKYEAPEAIFDEPAILININRRYDRKMSHQEIFEATRKQWKVNKKRVDKIKVACSVFRGIIREVFIVQHWLPSEEEKNRYYFDGEVAPETIRDKYRNKSVSGYWKQGSQYPIKYVDAQERIEKRLPKNLPLGEKEKRNIPS